jgi:SAM-dependent methyltransferase
MALSAMKGWLTHPLMRGRDINDPETTATRRKIVQDKEFLRKIYDEWYAIIVDGLPTEDGAILELGSGPGFLKDRIPDLLTSEVFSCSGIRLVADGCRLPFATSSLRAIVMTDVFHHLPDAELFFAEATRCIRPGGAVVMIEPWLSAWSRIIYTRIHHEPFEPDAYQWAFPSGGPLSGANGALPWIVFDRDRQVFEEKFPSLQIRSIEPFMPFRYLVSGGVSMRALTPGFTFNAWHGLEKLLQPWMHSLAMFAAIRLERVR